MQVMREVEEKGKLDFTRDRGSSSTAAPSILVQIGAADWNTGCREPREILNITSSMAVCVNVS